MVYSMYEYEEVDIDRGLGPHARRVYCKFIKIEKENGNLDFSVLVELKSKQNEVESFFIKTQLFALMKFYI